MKELSIHQLRMTQMCIRDRFYYNEVNWGQKIFDRKINDLINEREKFINYIEEFKKIYIDKE